MIFWPSGLNSFICSKQVLKSLLSWYIYTLIFCQAMGYKLRALFFSRLETTSHFSKSGAVVAAATAMGMGGIRWGNIISCTLGTTSAKKANSAVLKILKAKQLFSISYWILVDGILGKNPSYATQRHFNLHSFCEKLRGMFVCCLFWGPQLKLRGKTNRILVMMGEKKSPINQNYHDLSTG